jgi:membrane protease YdiL (CAAX protease family)
VNTISPPVIAAALLALAPYFVMAFAPVWSAGRARSLPGWLRIGCPAFLGLPYALVAVSAGIFSWGWLALYTALPVAVAVLLDRAPGNCVEPRTDWTAFLILTVLGLSVDLRWFERAWPPHLSIFNKVLLLDTGIYGFAALRNLPGVGFDLRLKGRDLRTGLREFLFYLPIALVLGLALGFLHLHPLSLDRGLVFVHFAEAWIFTFFFIAVPEELFFRGWLQNLLERRIGRGAALAVTAALFGLSHFNKRAAWFNWRYVLLAAIAGVFYGRAWRQDRRVGASAVTHSTVDAVWSLWLR